MATLQEELTKWNIQCNEELLGMGIKQAYNNFGAITFMCDTYYPPLNIFMPTKVNIDMKSKEDFKLTMSIGLFDKLGGAPNVKELMQLLKLRRNYRYNSIKEKLPEGTEMVG